MEFPGPVGEGDEGGRRGSGLGEVIEAQRPAAGDGGPVEIHFLEEAGTFPFDIELALTPPQMEQGLMFRRSLAADAGMLFDYGNPQPIAMWMKNTLIPLDMIFIAKDGKVVDFRERAVPMSLDTIESKVPARAVLEVNAGTVARLGVQNGDTIHHAFFGNALN